MQLAIEALLSLSEMYSDTFTNEKKSNFVMQTIDKKRATNLTCIHTICLVYAYFLSITCKSIICVSNDTNYCAFSIVHIIIILLAQ